MANPTSPECPTERTRQRLSDLVGSYPTASINLAPGMLHAIVTMALDEPNSRIEIAVSFLIKVANEQSHYEPSATLRHTAHQLLIRRVIPSFLKTPGKDCVVRSIAALTRFYAENPYGVSIASNVIEGRDQKSLQKFFGQIYGWFYGATPTFKKEPIDRPTFATALVNLGCWDVLVDGRIFEAIPILLKNVGPSFFGECNRPGLACGDLFDPETKPGIERICTEANTIQWVYGCLASRRPLCIVTTTLQEMALVLLQLVAIHNHDRISGPCYDDGK